MGPRAWHAPIAALAVIGAAACERRDEPPTPPPVSETPGRGATPEQAPEPVDPAPAPVVIGYATLPAEPDDAAIALNRRALAVHQRGDFEASEAAFHAVLEASPGYALARFNHACALARLGRLDEARVSLEALLAEDLPTFGPRLEADPDLAALREGAHAASLASTRARVEAAYRRALAEGQIVTRVAEVPRALPREGRVARRTVRVGVWLAGERRFVPMGPRVARSADEPEPSAMVLATGALDRELGIVISLTGLGRWSEGDNYIDRTEVSVHRAVTGEELARRRDPCARGPCRFPVLHAIEDGAVLGFAPEDADPDAPPRTIVLAGTGRYDAARRPRLECQQELCAIRYAEDRRTIRVRGPRRVEVTFAGGEQATVELDAAHAWHRAAEVSYGGFAVPDGARALFVATHESISFDWTPGHGAAAISRVEQGGEATLLLGGRGPVAIERAPDGSFYLQVGEVVARHAPGGVEGERLPEGLLLEPGPFHTFAADIYDHF